MSAPYEKFNHLRRALFWEPERIVAMLTFYGDAAYGTGNDYLVVAGIIATVAQWENKFCVDWRLTLAKAGLPEFHAAPFFGGAPPFIGWNTKEREGERNMLLADLSEIIGQNVLQAFACMIHLPSWRVLNDRYILTERCLTPYALCGRTAARFGNDWCRKTNRDPKAMEYIFDQGEHDWGDLVNRVRTDLRIELLPGDRRKLRPLQAADWIAYELFREIPQSETKIRVREIRKSLVSLIHSVPMELEIYRQKDLEKLCTNYDNRISRRPINDPKRK